MTKVFLDTNVILDHALDRAFADEAEKIFAMAEEGKISCYISTGSVYTLAYVLEKATKDIEIVREKLLLYLTFITPISNLPFIFHIKTSFIPDFPNKTTSVEGNQHQN